MCVERYRPVGSPMSTIADWFSVRISVSATLRFHRDTLLHPSQDEVVRRQMRKERQHARAWAWRTLKSWALRRPLPRSKPGSMWEVEP